MKKEDKIKVATIKRNYKTGVFAYARWENVSFCYNGKSRIMESTFIYKDENGTLWRVTSPSRINDFEQRRSAFNNIFAKSGLTKLFNLDFAIRDKNYFFENAERFERFIPTIHEEVANRFEYKIKVLEGANPRYCNIYILDFAPLRKEEIRL